eukprot:TRINITY_DN15589_c0_g1_i2.p1 TRINITY_DN15589_c0_g1~~TRINITY_DN15589_c0_g1_i2.p1  ORF type:complete len:489 (-),score=69.87 TRINITY_DN15589_c0_g1_i2:1212-2678(-)
MGGKKQKKFLTVAPFECAWRKELRFKEAGRGCVAFEAFAHNDVTVVFREHVGSQHYHYRMDNSRNYVVVLGSHRNRRLKIEADGKPVVDVAGIGLCCSSGFQSYWISIYDGLISIGKGNYPFQNIMFQWLDSKPNCNVQYVGLSSWDKHVGYRNINVLPLTQHNCLRKHIDYNRYEEEGDDEEEWDNGSDGYEGCGLENFLETWELSDMFFVVGVEEKAVPAHMAILSTSGNFGFSSCEENIIRLTSVTYPVLHALLQYIYTGRTQIVESQLGSLRNLSLQFQVLSLFKHCEEIIDRFKTNKKLFDSGKKVEIAHSSSRMQRCTVFPCDLPIDMQKLKQLLLTGEHSDLNIYIDGHGLIARSHKLILSLWSAVFTKMFTNGMSESNSSEICVKDVSVEAYSAMLQFMYSGELEIKDRTDMLLPLLLLADQFGVTFLHQECCKSLLEYLSEGWCCQIGRSSSSKCYLCYSNLMDKASDDFGKARWLQQN